LVERREHGHNLVEVWVDISAARIDISKLIK